MPKEIISASLDPDTVAKVDKMVKDGTFRSRSHAIEDGLKKLLTKQES